MSKELALQQADRFSLSGLNLELDNFINADKNRIKEIAGKAADSVSDGYADPVEALIFVKKGSELFKEMDSKIRPMAESKSIGKEYTKFGVKIAEAMTGVKYDYSSCGDPVYDELKTELDAIEKKVKERQEFLKTVTKSLTIVNDETGEVSTINPPVKSGKLGFTLTIK